MLWESLFGIYLDKVGNFILQLTLRGAASLPINLYQNTYHLRIDALWLETTLEPRTPSFHPQKGD